MKESNLKTARWQQQLFVPSRLPTLSWQQGLQGDCSDKCPARYAPIAMAQSLTAQSCDASARHEEAE